MQFLKLDHAKVASDFPHLQVDDAVVIANGDSVIVSAYVDPPKEGAPPVRPVRLDRLTKADVKATRGGTFAFSGVSDWALNQVGATREQAIITIRVSKWKGCEGCE